MRTEPDPIKFNCDECWKTITLDGPGAGADIFECPECGKVVCGLCEQNHICEGEKSE